MRVAVIGAGIIGVTTAFELAADGHEVTVFERRGAVAEETSFANAGVVAPGYVTPWAAPGMPGKVARFLLSDARAGPGDAAAVARRHRAGCAQWYRACELATYLANRTRMQRLAFYSRTRLHEITDHFELEYERSSGYMVLLRGEKDRKLVEPGLQVLRDAGVAFKEIDADEARKIEPAINPEAEFAGAIHLPDDEVGQLPPVRHGCCEAKPQACGVKFEFNTAVEPLDPAAPGSLHVWTLGDDAPVRRHFEAVIVCGGVDSAALLRPLGLRIPLAPVYGYSISAPHPRPAQRAAQRA